MGIYSESFVSNEVELSPLASPDNYEYNEEKIQQQTIGERGSGFRNKGHDVQDYYQLRDKLLADEALFEDTEFPATDASLYYSQKPPRKLEWLRPCEIVEDPKFIIDGASRFDIMQGELGDCWMLAAVANLTLNVRYFDRVVPNDQSFDDKYAGIFHFRFWQYGRWVDVVIDDRLPTYCGKLVYMHSSDESEFWSALLEKAFAKLNGSYEALKGGGASEAMEDFTAGVAEMFELKSAPQNMFQIMLKGFERQSLFACAIEADPTQLEAKTGDGLVKGHAYSITQVRYINISTPNKSGKIPMVRLRNPWGNETEWTGPWSDRSAEWRFISDGEKQEVGLTFERDGEFWMSFTDFVKKFDRLEMCSTNPESLPDELRDPSSKRKRWEMSVFEGEWVRGVSAGGCRNFLETFHHNPQYRITLEDPDEDDDEHHCSVVISLMQKNRRSLRRVGADCLTIGFAIYLLENPDALPKPLDYDFFRTHASTARAPSFVNLRSVTCRFQLPPGVYCIVPSTFEQNQQGEFLLRVFSEHKNNMEENDQPVDMAEKDERIKEAEPEPEQQKREDRIREFFKKLAGDDMEVDWMELKQILDYAMRNDVPRNSGDNMLTVLLSRICGTYCSNTPFAAAFEIRFEGFSKDVCRSMIALMDVDRSGKLGFDEFKKLWIDIKDWKAVFKLYDKDGTGYLSSFELRQALNSAGYQINVRILNILSHRYASKDGKISFDDFMMCAVRLKTMIEIFTDRSGGKTETASFTLPEWIETTLYS